MVECFDRFWLRDTPYLCSADDVDQHGRGVVVAAATAVVVIVVVVVVVVLVCFCYSDCYCCFIFGGQV